MAVEPKQRVMKNLVLGILPQPWWGHIDYWVRPKGSFLSKPLNDQAQRKRIVNQVMAAVDFTAVIETGTFRGATTEYFADRFGLPVYTCELQPRYFRYAKWRLRRYPNVTMVNQDSRACLQRLTQDKTLTAGLPFIYLDAHWQDDIPLAQELKIIFDAWRDAVIMIDDFAVPDDPGYGYDDYGPGKTLEIDLFDRWWDRGIKAFFPAASADQETGYRRGCVVIATPGVADRLMEVLSLRLYQPEAVA